MVLYKLCIHFANKIISHCLLTKFNYRITICPEVITLLALMYTTWSYIVHLSP